MVHLTPRVNLKRRVRVPRETARRHVRHRVSRQLKSSHEPEDSDDQAQLGNDPMGQGLDEGWAVQVEPQVETHLIHGLKAPGLTPQTSRYPYCTFMISKLCLQIQLGTQPPTPRTRRTINTLFAIYRNRKKATTTKHPGGGVPLP